MTYVKLDPRKNCSVTSAVGNGSPIALEDLNIEWRDDNGNYHNFLIPIVFHIPDSPVNILDLSAFSKAKGDFQNKGTRINSSGFIFT